MNDIWCLSCSSAFLALQHGVMYHKGPNAKLLTKIALSFCQSFLVFKAPYLPVTQPCRKMDHWPGDYRGFNCTERAYKVVPSPLSKFDTLPRVTLWYETKMAACYSKRWISTILRKNGDCKQSVNPFTVTFYLNSNSASLLNERR